MYSRSKAEVPPTKLQVNIDRLRFVLGVVAIIAIAVTFVLGQQANNAQDARIKKIESPCLRYGPRSKECHKAFGAAIKSITPYQLCVLLSRQPELTGVKPETCVKVAREARERAEAERKQGAQSAPGSPGVQSPGRGSGSQPVANSAPPAGGHSGGGGPAHPTHTPGSGPHQPPQAPPSSPTIPGPAPSPGPASPGRPPAEPANPPSPSAPKSPSVPPVVEVEVPVLPAHACVPGVLSVNC